MRAHADSDTDLAHETVFDLDDAGVIETAFDFDKMICKESTPLIFVFNFIILILLIIFQFFFDIVSQAVFIIR